MQIILLAASATEHTSLFEALYTNPIFNVGFMLLLAIIGGKLIERLNFPKVTAPKFNAVVVFVLLKKIP